MSDIDLKYKVMNAMNGIKYMQTQQIENFKAYMYHTLGIEKTENRDKVIVDTIALHFSIDAKLDL